MSWIAFARLPAILDEVPRRMGQWFLTGSREAALMMNVTESMAGRAAVLQLLPLSARESSRVSILSGGYPEALARPGASSLWFSSYVQAYLERDVRSVSAVHDLQAFRRFLALIASRHGGILNKSDIAGPLGMSVPSVGRWLDILEATAQILVVPPFFENVGKRLIKSPKVSIADSGLACHLLGIRSAAELGRSPFAGPLFEGFIASEIVKAQMNAGKRRELYYFRDQQGLEVDFIVPGESGGLRLIEAKSTATPTPDMAVPMLKLARVWKGSGHARGSLSMVLVHQPRKSAAISRALAPGVQAPPWTEFLSAELYGAMSLGTHGADLDTIVVDPPLPADAAVIMLHGLGADGHDFESIANEMGLPERPSVRWVLPHAPVMPVTINGGQRMRAWHDIASLDRDGIEDEAGIRRSAQAIGRLIQGTIDAGIPARRIVLAGFSQGGAMALFTGPRWAESLAGVAALSCWLPLADSLYREASPANAHVPLFMAHGTLDPVVPFAMGVESRDRLRTAGRTVDWHEYPMPHAVCGEELEDLRLWLLSVLALGP